MMESLEEYHHGLVDQVHNYGLEEELFDQEAFFDVTCQILRDNEVIAEYAPSPPMDCTISGWKTTIATHAITTDRKSVTSAGNRLAMRTIVAIGTINSQAEILNELPSVSVNSATWIEPSVV